MKRKTDKTMTITKSEITFHKEKAAGYILAFTLENGKDVKIWKSYVTGFFTVYYGRDAKWGKTFRNPDEMMRHYKSLRSVMYLALQEINSVIVA